MRFQCYVPSQTKTLIIFVSSLLSVFYSRGQTSHCLQTEFLGVAAQAKPFSQDIGSGVTFSVEPIRSREDPNQTWFVIRVIGNDAGQFVFNPSDSNWILATSGSAAFIGGPDSDLPAALGFRSRQLLVPLSAEDKKKAREAANLVYGFESSKREREAVNALKPVHLAQANFEIADYALGPGEPPIAVDWVRFN